MQQPKAPETGLFVGGLIVGLFVGGLPLMAVDIVVTALLVNAGGLTGSRSTIAVLLLTLIPVAALGFLAFRYTRKHVDFLSGIFVGATAGLLGGTSLCVFLLNGFSTMH